MKQKGKRVAKSPRRAVYARVLSLLLCLALAAALVPPMPTTLGLVTGWDAESHTYTINDFNSLIGAAEFSKTETGCKPDVRYVMTADIHIGNPENPDEFLSTLESRGIDHLTFGNEKFPFQGTFDGQGHIISGLKYENKIFKVAMRTGLFSYTERATIKNLTIKDANMHADTINGILVSEARATHFENVTVDSSFSAVNPADNALLLITDGGVIGGGMVAYANGCTFYNCQVSNTNVVVNSVSGVAALAGKGLYLGGLVGAMQFSTVEYSRVLGGKVSNRYESSVGALGGFTLYSGGLIGCMEQQSKLIDSFATCNVSFHAATYVGVAAGCTGNVGGLVSRVKDGSCQLIRSHYAGGTLSSFQYNTLLLFIPVQVDRDIYISGLVEEFDGDRALVKDCFFNEADTLGPSWGEKPGVLHNSKTSPSFGPQPDERYMDRAFWESHGYDFTGTVDRSVENFTGPFPHTNKWVMYYYEDPVLDKDGNPTKDEAGNPITVHRGYPVHGQSVAATFDFPGAAAVTLQATDLATSLSDTPETTTDPYRFAVLGFYPTEAPVTEYADGRKTGGVHLSIAMNEGYRLVNWYLEEDVTAAGLPDGQHDYFERLFAQESKLRTDLGADNDHLEVADNQLYVAYCQAQVAFHDLNGSVLNTSGAEDANLDDDYYDYATPLPDVVPQQNAPANTKLIGWTTTPAAGGAGWESINTTQLRQLQDAGAFYEAGDEIKKTMQLYPVYANQLLNVHTQIEGYDSETNKNYRAVLGETHVTSEGDRITLHVFSHLDPANPSDTADFPEGYRFLGWYEDGHCVSRERDYTLPDTVNLNVEHTYEARFEYRVQYYVNYMEQDNQDGYYADPTLYATRWELYNAPFTNLKAPDFYRNIFQFWSLTGPQDKDGNTEGTAVAFADPIQNPVTVYSNYKKAGTGPIASTVTVTSDFPHAAELSSNNDYPMLISTTPQPHYNMIFANMEGRLGSGLGYEHHIADLTKVEDAYQSSYESTEISISKVYVYTSHLDADVIFHEIAPQTGSEVHKYTVTRRFEEPVFSQTPIFYDYKCTLKPDESVGMYTDVNGQETREHKSEASPADPYYRGYYFVGWIDVDDPDTKSALDWIYDVSGYRQNLIPDGSGRCLTSDPERAKPYVLDETDLVTRAMPNLYPVYAGYDVKTTTNVFLEIEGELNKPADPAYVLADDTAPVTTATVTAHNHVAVHDHVAEGETQEYYDLESVTLSVDGGAPVTLVTEKDGAFVLAQGVTCVKEGASQDWKLTYEVHPGKHYVFTAVYKPYIVVYHVNGNDGPKVLLRNYGDAVAKSYLPEIQDSVHALDYALFVGWTEQVPENGLYHYFPTPMGGKSSYDQAKEFGFWTLTQTEDTIVTRSMELWPVFATYTVTVDSNIDRELVDSGKYTEATLGQVRSLERLTANTVSTTVKAAEVDGYKFMGWYTDAKQPDGSYDFTNAKAISEAEEYTLQNEEPFTDKLYTARYQRVYEVIYHGPDGEPYYTDYLFEGADEGKQLNTIVKYTTEVTSPDGSVAMQEIEYQKPLSSQPYFQMYQKLAKNQVFGQWYRFTADGAREAIYQFDQMPIIPTAGKTSLLDETHRQLHLYPSIWTTNVYDSTNTEITPDNDVLSTLTGMEQDHTTGAISAYVDVRFNPQKPYTQNKLTVHVERAIWDWNGGAPREITEMRENVHVSLFPDDTQPHGEKNAVSLAEKDTDAEGNAVFELNQGLLRIVKTVPLEAQGETFLFQITDVNDPAKTWKVPLICDMEYYGGVLEDVLVGYYGRARIYLPVGTYKVEEVADWCGSRYTATYEVRTRDDVPITGKVTVDPETGTETHQITNLNVPVTLVDPRGAIYTEVFCQNTPNPDAYPWLTASVGKDNRYFNFASETTP